jgi:hypothetical protein
VKDPTIKLCGKCNTYFAKQFSDTQGTSGTSGTSGTLLRVLRVLRVLQEHDDTICLAVIRKQMPNKLSTVPTESTRKCNILHI